MFYLTCEKHYTEMSIQAIALLDYLVLLWERRGFREEAVDSECVNWIQLLLSMVNIKGDRPDVLLSKFFVRGVVCKKHRRLIIKQVSMVCA